MTDQQPTTGSAVGEAPMPNWCKNVIWLHIMILVLTGVVSVRGSARIFASADGLALISALLLWSKVIIGLTADSSLLRRNPRGLKLAIVAATIAVAGGVFTLLFVDAGAGASPDSWAYQNRSGIQLFLFVFGLGWNALYLLAAHRSVRGLAARETAPMAASG